MCLLRRWYLRYCSVGRRLMTACRGLNVRPHTNAAITPAAGTSNKGADTQRCHLRRLLRHPRRRWRACRTSGSKLGSCLVSPTRPPDQIRQIYRAWRLSPPPRLSRAIECIGVLLRTRALLSKPRDLVHRSSTRALLHGVKISLPVSGVGIYDKITRVAVRTCSCRDGDRHLAHVEIEPFGVSTLRAHEAGRLRAAVDRRGAAAGSRAFGEVAAALGAQHGRAWSPGHGVGPGETKCSSAVTKGLAMRVPSSVGNSFRTAKSTASRAPGGWCGVAAPREPVGGSQVRMQLRVRIRSAPHAGPVWAQARHIAGRGRKQSRPVSGGSSAGDCGRGKKKRALRSILPCDLSERGVFFNTAGTVQPVKGRPRRPSRRSVRSIRTP